MAETRAVCVRLSLVTDVGFIARALAGMPYRSGAVLAEGALDEVSFVQHVWRALWHPEGPWNASINARTLRRFLAPATDGEALAPGDVAFYGSGGEAVHVALVTEVDQMGAPIEIAHCSPARGRVVIEPAGFRSDLLGYARAPR